MTSLTDPDLLRELEPVAAANIDRHLGLAVDWMPHEYVPWSQGRDFDTLPWEPEQSALSEIAQLAFEVNLLTEDNLPSYHREIAAAYGRDGAWGAWVGRWTAEEGRHAIAMRDYLMVTRGVDPAELERGRMHQMQQGYDSGNKTPLQVIAYVTFQELATRIAHRNTGRFTEDPIAEKLLARVAADENLHMIFYRNLVTAALELDLNRTVQAIRDEVIGFAMPGTGIINFDAKARRIADAGIYDLRIHHDEVLTPILRQWKFFALEGLDDTAEQARSEVAAFLEGLDALANHQAEKRAARAARVARAADAELAAQV
ncbi:acyl-ACP desaturase [Frankia sp. CNm7]|uniref:Acyl-ACP desaturase n=1 Tax=Frankia nepalensis TaxID=1836974 RepID=A0A937UT45_9ACTN|nr:acyl-ACP desaturase [Frankia nepalensis]MBL7500704.1 acyl-ACP desaturase [Frankia nepalensis]MBL7514469.1 acyl-ACP desaturase [Frankia nepalensis]MBL7523556.1 acyl-ACP desaturase [Frankia nepalensis]MBL7632743.1 acyl-ACP desaturase [Frankia nepalensis]